MYTAMLFLSLIVFVGVAVHFWRSGLCSVFHPFTYYLAFQGLLFVFRPMLAHFRGYDRIYYAYKFMPSLTEKLTVLAAANLGFLVFYFFCTHAGHSRMAFKIDSSRFEERAMLRRVLPIMLILCLPLGIYSLLKGVATSVDANTTMIMSSQGIVINTSSNGYVTEGTRLLVPICAMFAWLYRFRWYALMPLVTFAVLKAATGGRGGFVVAAAVTALFYFYDQRAKLPGFKAAVAVAAMAMAFSAVGSDRGYALREALGFENQGVLKASREARFLEGMDFANKEYFEYVVHVVPKRSGTYDYFLSNLQILTEPIPRILWASKPIGAPIQLFKWFDYGTPFGFTMSLPGVGWFELGWLGVVIWCGLWGWGTGRFYEWFVNSPQSALQVSTYLVSLATLIVAYRDGTFLTIARGQLFYMFPLIVMLVSRKAWGLPKLGAIQREMMARFRKQQTVPGSFR